MQDQPLLTVPWVSFEAGSSDIVTSIVIRNGGRYSDYG